MPRYPGESKENQWWWMARNPIPPVFQKETGYPSGYNYGPLSHDLTYYNTGGFHVPGEGYTGVLNSPSGGGGTSLPPSTPPPPPEYDPLLWRRTYDVAGADSFWKGLTPNKVTKQTRFYAMLNALIPFLSPEDRRSIGTTLSRYGYNYEDEDGKHFAEPFSKLDPTKTTYGAPPSDLTTEDRKYYTGAERARQARLTLERMAASMGIKTDSQSQKLGPGYIYLKQVAKTLEDFGAHGTDGQTRRQHLQLLGQLDTLLKEGQGEELAEYGSIASRLASPFFSARQLVPVQQADGTYRFGTYNKNIGG